MFSALGVLQLEPQMLQSIGFFGTKAEPEVPVFAVEFPLLAPW